MLGPLFDFPSPSKWIKFPDGITASNSSAPFQVTFAVSIPHLSPQSSRTRLTNSTPPL
jgi:hypothetical protein